jgi:hypothetical protein
MSIDVLGTHNLLDGKAEAEAFGCDVVGYTEAPPDIYDDDVSATHKLFRPRQQRDLVIALRRSIAEEAINVKEHYRLVHIGVIKVTPHRGIFWITFEYMGKLYAIIVEHRINAWYRPWRRGERYFRSRMWRLHTWRSNRIQRKLLAKGYIVIAMGDPNAPEGVKAYPLLNETQDAHMDRVAASFPLGDTEELGKEGSDHHRLRVRRKRKIKRNI